jgi:hypothetical protein
MTIKIDAENKETTPIQTERENGRRSFSISPNSSPGGTKKIC